MTFLNDFLVFLLFHSVIIQINKTKEKVTEVKKRSFFSVNYLRSPPLEKVGINTAE